MSFRSLALQEPALADDILVVRWAPGGEHPFREVLVPGANRGQSHLAALSTWSAEHDGDVPDRWIILDDDVVLGRGTIDAMMRVLDADPDIALIGAWNCCSEWNRGRIREIAGEQVQVGDDFCIGGAVCAMPGWAITEIGPYRGDRPWVEDSDLTSRVLAAGKKVALVRSRFAAILHDDGVDPHYRIEATARFRLAVQGRYEEAIHGRDHDCPSCVSRYTHQ